MTSSGVREVSRVSHPCSSKYKWLAVFIAYFDDSGHPSDSVAMSVGGVIAKASSWEKFEVKWSKRLRRAKKSAFHATDYECRRGEFTDWDNDKRISFIHDLAAIVKNTVACGVTSSVVMADWFAVMPAKFERSEFVAKKGAYLLLFQLCIESLVKHAGIPRTETVSCVFDENQFVRGALAEHYSSLKRDLGLEDKLGSLTFGNGKKFLPLQAADMMAYEGFKHTKNQIAEGGSHDVRKLYLNLRASDRIHHFLLDQDGLRGYVKAIENVS